MRHRIQLVRRGLVVAQAVALTVAHPVRRGPVRGR